MRRESWAMVGLSDREPAIISLSRIVPPDIRAALRAMHIAVAPQLIVVADLVTLMSGVGGAFFVVVDDVGWLGH